MWLTPGLPNLWASWQISMVLEALLHCICTYMPFRTIYGIKSCAAQMVIISRWPHPDCGVPQRIWATVVVQTHTQQYCHLSCLLTRELSKHNSEVESHTLVLIHPPTSSEPYATWCNRMDRSEPWQRIPSTMIEGLWIERCTWGTN